MKFPRDQLSYFSGVMYHASSTSVRRGGGGQARSPAGHHNAIGITHVQPILPMRHTCTDTSATQGPNDPHAFIRAGIHTFLPQICYT